MTEHASRSAASFALALALASTPAAAQELWALCDGPPPLGWAWCACELTSDGHKWVCYDEWGTGIPGLPPSTPEDNARSKPFFLPSPLPQAGLNVITTDLRATVGGARRLRVYRGWDANGNHIVETSERVEFCDASTLLGVGRVLEVSIDETRLGRVRVYFAVEDGGLVVAEDLDGDGVARSPGELRVALGVGSLRTVPGANATVTMDYRAFERIASSRRPSGPSRLLGWEAHDLCVYELEDLNGDGDYADLLERRNLFNAAAVLQSANVYAPVRSGWTLNADVAAGALPSAFDTRRLTASLGALAYTEQPIAVNPAGHAYYFASTLTDDLTGTTRSGLIYRGIDLGQDGDVNDAGEVTLFYDPRTASPIRYPIRRVLDVVAEGLDFYVLQDNGPLAGNGRALPTCWRLRDLNLDGDAMDAGEATLVFTARKNDPLPTELERVPSGLAPRPAAVHYGWACAGSTGLPQQRTVGLPQICNPTPLLAGIANAPASVQAGLLVGYSRETFGSARSLPLPLGAGGCWLLQSADLVLPGFTSPTGTAQWSFGAAPCDPLLAGASIYTQAFALDPQGSAPLVLTDAVWWYLDL
jgi:hypothetical protein